MGSQLPVRVYDLSESVARTFLYIECQNLVAKESEQTVYWANKQLRCVAQFRPEFLLFEKKIVHRIMSPYERHFLIGLVPNSVRFMITWSLREFVYRLLNSPR